MIVEIILSVNRIDESMEEERGHKLLHSVAQMLDHFQQTMFKQNLFCCLVHPCIYFIFRNDLQIFLMHICASSLWLFLKIFLCVDMKVCSKRETGCVIRFSSFYILPQAHITRSGHVCRECSATLSWFSWCFNHPEALYTRFQTLQPKLIQSFICFFGTRQNFHFGHMFYIKKCQKCFTLSFEETFEYKHVPSCKHLHFQDSDDGLIQRDVLQSSSFLNL